VYFHIFLLLPSRVGTSHGILPKVLQEGRNREFGVTGASIKQGVWEKEKCGMQLHIDGAIIIRLHINKAWR
jgi:hypothetical protein